MGRWLLALVALAAEVLALPTWAQNAQLEEVVVTARKRDEAFQNVPITVDAFTTQTIQSAGIQSPRDFVALVPNMTMVETQNVGNSFITIRGISQARNSEPSVAVLVDGVLETNPYQFNTELFDIRQIEVLKGPQGALYGRDAIGGAIIIHTADPSDHFEGQARVGVGNGTSERAQIAVSGPIDEAGTLRYRASFNFYNTDGYLNNVTLNDKADPLREYSARMRWLWRPQDKFTADLRLFYDRVETTAYYFIIPRDNEANPFSTFTTPPNANDVTSPIRNNNQGTDNRDVFDVSLKLDYFIGAGTFTAITNYDQTKEIDTGDAYDFRPVTTSIAYNAFFTFVPPALGGTFDESQSQFIRSRAWSQELRYTSEKVGGFSWIAGAYFIHTERFTSTGNLVDRGFGVPPVYETPIVDPTNPFANNTNVTFLADSQNNNAWAVFADATYEFNPQWELDVALRYDSDTRQNTTDTPQQFLPDPAAKTGEVRKRTWSEPQPKATLTYKPVDYVTVYGGWSRGFRSGGFNQTGVGAVAAAQTPPVKGVNDTFEAEVADTWEIGAKTQWFDRRLSANIALYHTKSTNGYFFVYLPANSTQNLGNIDATYKGGEIELTAKPTDRLDVYASFGYTDSEITGMAAPSDPTVIGKQAPLVSQHTINAGALYRQPLGAGLTGTIRLDFQNIGRTWWDPYNVTSRDPVSLLDLRLGVQAEKWTVTAWSRNLTNKIYNAEFSPGGFLWRAPPRRYGVDFDYRF
jgi:iron complex outermembrane receptor protein